MSILITGGRVVTPNGVRFADVLALEFVGLDNSAALTQAADEILAEPRVEARRFVPLSTAEAVLRYATDFIPSWAGAISIDLLPVVLVLVLMIVNDAMRKDSQSLEEAERLNEQVYRQQLQIERLQQEVARLAERQAEAAPPGFRSLRDELPPHY